MTNPYQPPQAASESSAPTPAGSHVRFMVLALGLLMSVMLYLHRFAMSGITKTIETDLGLGLDDIGVVTKWFFYIYAFAQVPAGWLSDRLGARLTLTLYVAVWSLALAGMGTATGLFTLCLFRSLLGLAQAGAYPCAAGMVRKWFPVQRRGVANATVAMGGRAGSLIAIALTPFLVGEIASLLTTPSHAWRIVFLIYAAVGIVWAIVFVVLYRNSPAEHQRCNSAEIAFIAGNEQPALAQATEVPTRSLLVKVKEAAKVILTSPTVWITCLIGVAVNAGWIFLVAYLPRYLEDQFSLSAAQAGVFAMIPGIGSMIGGVCGGAATDMLVRRCGLKWGRRLTGICAGSGAAAMYLILPHSTNVFLTVAIFGLTGLLIDFGLGSLWAVYQDITRKHVAVVLAFANMCGNLAAGRFSQFFGKLAKDGEWNQIFYISAAALVVMSIGWSLVNAEKKLAGE